MKWVVILLVLYLQGCSGLPMMFAGVASLTVSETTGKSVTDNALSAVNDKDCKTLRMFSSDPICQENIPQVQQPASLNSVADMEKIFEERKMARQGMK